MGTTARLKILNPNPFIVISCNSRVDKAYNSNGKMDKSLLSVKAYVASKSFHLVHTLYIALSCST